MTIDRNSLLHYSLLGKDDALTQDEVRKVVHLYLEEHYDGNQQFVKWPKEIKEVCANLGIVQDRETGFPSDKTQVHIARKRRDDFVRHENEMLRHENVKFRKMLRGLFNLHGTGPASDLDLDLDSAFAQMMEKVQQLETTVSQTGFHLEEPYVA